MLNIMGIRHSQNVYIPFSIFFIGYFVNHGARLLDVDGLSLGLSYWLCLGPGPIKVLTYLIGWRESRPPAPAPFLGSETS